MINNYSIKNFKIHKDFYNLQLNGLTIFTGTNNSGKTSLTQSIRILSKINDKSYNYTYLPLEEIPELTSLSRTLNKGVKRSDSIVYKFSLDIPNFNFYNVELEFDSIYNYKHAFIDMMDKAILKRLNIYFESKDGTTKDYEFLIKDEENVFKNVYLLYELSNSEINNKVLIEDNIIIRGIMPTYIPTEPNQSLILLANSLVYLGNINQNSIKYLGPYRFIGNKSSTYSNILDEKGSNVADIVNLYKDSFIFDGKTRFIEAFNIWTNKILNTKFNIKTEANEYKLITSDNNIDFELDQIGFGNIQVIPVIVSILTAKKGDLIIIENPEVHLHPRWKANLVELFYFAVKNNVNILIETQSLELINRIRVSVKHNENLKDKTALYFFEKKGLESNIFNIEIENTGNLSMWPEDFIDRVTIDDSFELL